jgi:hypothetical protein
MSEYLMTGTHDLISGADSTETLRASDPHTAGSDHQEAVEAV